MLHEFNSRAGHNMPSWHDGLLNHQFITMIVNENKVMYFRELRRPIQLALPLTYNNNSPECPFEKARRSMYIIALAPPK